MKIDRNNYEAYFIDYLDGNLDETLVNDFIEFIQQNPDLKDELALFNSVKIPSEEVVFSKKEKLFKEKYDAEKEFNYAAIASIENDLSETEQQEFESYISKHPEKQGDLVLFSKTKLQSDKSVKFSKKNKLYHYTTGRTVLLWTSRVAAVLIFAIAVYVFMDRTSSDMINENQVASVEKKGEVKDPVSETKQLPAAQEKTEDKIPVNTEDKKQVKSETVKPATPVKPEPKAKNNFRETTKGRLDQEQTAMQRIPVEAPVKIGTIAPSLNNREPEATLAKMNIIHPESPDNISEERFIADVVKEKTGLDNLSLNKITKAGLNLVSSISKEKFNYETNENGDITEVSFDTRLLAFSIPTKNDGNGNTR